MMMSDPSKWFFLPQDDIQSVVQTRSVDVVGTALYNYTDGYGTYLIPAVLMVVIFQTLIFVISMLSGKERETGDILMFAGPEGRDLSFLRMASVVIGKSFTYLVFYALFSVFLLGLLPLVFPIASFSISVENCGTYDTLYSCYQFLWIGLFVIFQ